MWFSGEDRLRKGAKGDLLPFAWGQRLCGYLREGPVLGSVKEIVKTGRKRKEILREYGIFGEKRR